MLKNKEKLSAFMDDEYNKERFIQEILKDGSLKEDWQEFHRLGSIMRGEYVNDKGKNDLKKKLRTLEQPFKQEEVSIAKIKRSRIGLKKTLWRLFFIGLVTNIFFIGIALGNYL